MPGSFATVRLAAYRRARAVLAEELGIEPGEELRPLERAVLRQQVPAAAPRRQLHNLPARLTSFLGRQQELAALDELAAEARLVTVTGAGGAGKTRLAVEFAAAAIDRFGDGVWLAGLAGITDPGLVSAQVMAARGVRQTGQTPVIQALRYRLRTAELLLVLDDCEHLPGACAALAADLLGACPSKNASCAWLAQTRWTPLPEHDSRNANKKHRASCPASSTVTSPKSTSASAPGGAPGGVGGARHPRFPGNPCFSAPPRSRASPRPSRSKR